MSELLNWSVKHFPFKSMHHSLFPYYEFTSMRLKFNFSEKATKICANYLCSKCQNHKTFCTNFCGLLRKAELYKPQLPSLKLNKLHFSSYLHYTVRIMFMKFNTIGSNSIRIRKIYFPKAVTYDKRPKMKRDAKLKAVFF